MVHVMNDLNVTGEAGVALTPFSEMLAGLRRTDADGNSDEFVTTLPYDWLQGRTSYGGLTAAISLEVVQRSFADLAPLRSAQFAFIGPAAGELRLHPQILRQGKSTVFAGLDLYGDSGLAVRSLFCFGTDRHSTPDFARNHMPAVPEPVQCPPFFSWPNMPNFMAHFDGHLAGGQFPLSGHIPPEMLVWVRHRDQSAPDDLVRLIAAADALPPTAFAAFDEAVPISTMTWAVDILDPDLRNDTGWWLIDNLAETIRAGYSAQTTMIWSPDGRPVLSARQNVAIFGPQP
jgi:acyl-CoA thioesterase